MGTLGMKRSLKIVAPWYHWERQWTTDGMAPRDSRPVLQKFDRPDMVGGFTADPQHSLTFVDEDHVYDVSSTLPSGASYLERLAGAILSKTDTRKLFLPTHHRFYLVVCQLCCDAPGLPDACRKRVAQAGFVVRRYGLTQAQSGAGGDASAADVAEALSLVKQLGAAVRALRKVSSSGLPGLLTRQARKASGTAAKIVTKFESTRAQKVKGLAGDMVDLKKRLAELPAAAVEAVLPQGFVEGWVPSEHDGIGSWQVVDETSGDVVERTYPLYPLVPDPTAQDHSAEGATLYFGLVPTSSMDTDAWGTPQLDADRTYAIRCFVREKDDAGCLGPAVWSAPTEAFRLAPHMDPVGTANRSITIQMPDLNALAAHATTAGGPPGGVRMVTPDASMLQFQVSGDGLPTGGSAGGGQICFFYIPLITIIARFVLSLFLPVVVFVFQLWWMLLLKLCIMPSASFQADLEAAAALEGSFDASVSADVDIQVAVLSDMSGLKANSGGNLFGSSALEGPDGNQVAAMAAKQLDQISTAADREDASQAGTVPGSPGAPASLVDALVYETRIYGRPTVTEVVQEEVA